MSTYKISADSKSITCGKCGCTSYNPHDVRALFCGRCHFFHTPDGYATKPTSSPLTDGQLEKIMPGVSWRNPISITAGTKRGFACRYCLAKFGTNAADVDKLPQTEADFAIHMQEHHQPPKS